MTAVPRILSLAVLLATALRAEPAAAQWLGMDRQDGRIKANLQASVVLDKRSLPLPLENPDREVDFVYLQNDIYLQGAYKGLGGYLLLPYAVSVSKEGSFASIGNMEVGALWDVPFPMLYFTLHAGVGMPMASSAKVDQDNIGESRFARFTDLALDESDIVSVRLGSAIRIPAGILSARADVGFDLLIPIAEGTDASDFNTIFRFNVGAGLMWNGWGGTVEYIVATKVVDSKVSFADGKYHHGIAISGRVQTNYLEIYLGLTLPLTKGLAGEIYGVTLGFTSLWEVKDDVMVPTTEY